MPSKYHIPTFYHAFPGPPSSFKWRLAVHVQQAVFGVVRRTSVTRAVGVLGYMYFLFVFVYQFVYVCSEACVCAHLSTYEYVDTAAPQKCRACNRPGRPFCDKTCNGIGVSCDKPSLRQAHSRLQYSAQKAATRVCNRGPATKVCNTGHRDKPLFRVTAVYVYKHSTYISNLYKKHNNYKKNHHTYQQKKEHMKNNIYAFINYTYIYTYTLAFVYLVQCCICL